MVKRVMIGKAFVMLILAMSVLTFWGATESKAKTKTTEYLYYVDSDGGVNIRGYIGKKKKVTIPAKIDGRDVVSIKGLNISLTSVTIPNSVTSIEGGIFWNCKKLEKVKLSKNITTIPARAFKGCDSLTTVNRSANVSKIEFQAFADCGKLKSVGDLTLTEIGYEAFSNCKKLTGTFTLDSSIEEIPGGSFYNCKKLALRIPDKDLKVGEFAFAGCMVSTRYISPDVNVSAYAGCTNVDSVVVKDDNVVEENGIYYSKDRKTLVYVRPDYSGTLDFLKQVDTIGAYAFSGFRQKKVEIPDNIVEIQEGAFYGAKCKSVVWNKNVKNIAANMFMESALEKVVIPEGVETIGRRALWNMPKCVSVSIPASVKTWVDYDLEDGDVFTGVLEGFPVLKTVTVASGNTVFKSKKGLLFSKTNRLLCYPAGKTAKTYKIPKNIRVWEHAFSNVKNLKVTFRFGSSITGCFVNCKNVRVILPKSGIAFAGEGHEMDWPLFENCTKCYAIVKKNSYVHKKFKKLAGNGGIYESAYAYKVA